MTNDNEKTSSLPQIAEAEEPSHVEMSAEDYSEEMRKVYLGESDTLPDGRLVKEVRENIQRLEKEQDEARAQLGTAPIKQAESAQVTVSVTSTGVVSAGPVQEEAAEETIEVSVKPPPTLTPPAENPPTGFMEHSVTPDDPDSGDED